MTELTNEDLYQIKEALKTAIKALQNRIGRVAEAEMKELKDAFQLLDAALYPMPAAPAAKVEAAPVAAKAKLLTPTQMNLARRMDGEASVYVPYGSVLYRTAKPMWTKGLIEIVEKSNLGNYYGLTEKGYDALHATSKANRS